MPKSNVEFWKTKLENNRKRDCKNIERLRNAGWCVIVVWECELKRKNREARLESLIREILEPRV